MTAAGHAPFDASQAASQALPVQYFDGRSAKAQPVLLSIRGAALQLHAQHDGMLVHTAPLADVRWPERTQRGARLVEFAQGGQLHAHDARAYDAWAAQHLPRPESVVVRLQQSWRGAIAALALLASVLAGLYVWGLPVAARGIVSLVPLSVDEALGRNTLTQIDGKWMLPSKLPAATQDRLRTRCDAAMRKAYPQNLPAYQLEFRQSTIGPNAFALPGGTMVLTDELVTLVNDDDVVMGVMGHEIGHVTLRHGMRQLVQLAVVQGVLSIAFGDYGTLITTAPLILGSMAYSRNAEREADDHAIRFMQANAISPLVMVKFFSTMRVEQKTKGESTPMGISIISSHPADAERVAKFKAAAPAATAAP
jgi:Zn-dependent protease with chaperone function